jgi:hypothetical protein
MRNGIKVTAFLLVWWICGLSGFWYWEGTKFDVHASELPLVFMVGAAGPLSWVIGWSDSDSEHDPIVIHRRKSRAADGS